MQGYGKLKRILLIYTFLLSTVYYLLSVYSWAQEEGFGSEQGGSQLSREMELAIRLYNRGKDEEAMDRFMNILVRGDPNEKALANDYLNRLTHRMNTGETQAPVTPALPQVVSSMPKVEKPKEDLGEETGEPPEEKRQDLMRRQIESRIKEMRIKFLERLEPRGIQMLLENDLPKALGLESKLFFKDETSFNLPQSEEILEDVTGLLYALGEARVVVVPEGFLTAESRIQDMRRAMAVASHLLRRGLSPARIQVALLGTPVDLPRSFHRFSGVVLVFLYGKEPILRQPTSVGEESGPQISLGVSPGRFDPGSSEGSIIEFSVLEPSVGLAAWKFQLLHVLDGDRATTIQEVTGSEPAFHQIFWNGRQNFFGEALPPGRYLCVLSASDVKGREATLRSYILLGSTPELVAAVPLSVTKGAAESPKPVVVRRLRKPHTRLIRGVNRAMKVSPKSRRRFKKRKRIPVKKATAASSSAVSRTVSYEVNFLPGSVSLTPESEKKLSQVANSMNYYPLAKLTLVGYAYEGEANADTIADQRARVVADLLVNQYHVGSERLQVQTKILNQEVSKVEVYLTGGE
ncbi:MAG: OmpA family protein [Elusimicrobia bacterium]|nr:OmpA family protein [Elusimicrobiota bacterium]